MPGSVRVTLAAVLLLVATACASGGGGSHAAEGEPARAETAETVETAETAETATTGPPSTGPATASPSATSATGPVDVNALRPPAPVGEPGGLATRIAGAEATLRAGATGTGTGGTGTTGQAGIATAALAQQVAYRELGDHPEWDEAVIAALPPELGPVVRSHVAARREFRALGGPPADMMPAWRIVPPDPADQLQAWYREAEAEFGVPWQVLAAVNLVETGLGRIRGTSVAGAQGPMQFLPSTWAAYGEGDINDTRQAIRAAGRYLAANHAAGDLAGALWNYNHSNHYVQGVLLYADLIAEHPGAWAGFHHWGVWYTTVAGDLFLPVGYEATERIPVDQYLASAPG